MFSKYKKSQVLLRVMLVFESPKKSLCNGPRQELTPLPYIFEVFGFYCHVTCTYNVKQSDAALNI